MDLRVNVAAIAVALGCGFLVASRVSSAPREEASAAGASAEQRAMFAASVAAEEPGWRHQAENDFPSDLWSQRDAFHGHEAQSVRELAGSANVPYEEVIRAIDEDVHRTPARPRTEARPVERSAGAVPCKPRPFYD